MSQYTIPEGYVVRKFQIPMQLGFLPAPRESGTSIHSLRQETEKVSKFCANCFASPDTLMRCGTCKKAFYCNINCQTEDWKTEKDALELAHKSVCKLLKEGTELGDFYQKIEDILSRDDFKKEVVCYQGLTFAIFNNPKKRTYVHKTSPNPDFIINSLNGLMQGNLRNSPDFVAPSRGAALAIASNVTQLTPKIFGPAKKVLDLFNITTAMMSGIEPLLFQHSTFHFIEVDHLLPSSNGVDELSTKMENLQTSR